MKSELDIPKLAVAVLTCELIGAAGSLFTVAAIPGWYAMLNKPVFTPPSWLFAPVWLILYLLMGIAAYLIWKNRVKDRTSGLAMLLFCVQLALNFAWTYLFFGLHSQSYGMIGIVVLWFAITATIAAFWRVSRKAALLLLPYIAWVTFALLLNLFILVMNM